MAIEKKPGVVPPSQGPLSSRYVDSQRKANAPKTHAGQWNPIFNLFHRREGKPDGSLYSGSTRCPYRHNQAVVVVIVVIIVIIILAGSSDQG